MECINVFICLRNNSNTIHKTLNTFELLEDYFNLHYFIFENDSYDDTPSIIENFMKHRKGQFSSNTFHKIHWDSVQNSSRSRDMAFYRNSMKNLCTDFSNRFSIILDSDIEFSLSTINSFIDVLIQYDHIAMVTPFSTVGNSDKYYDTYALLTQNNKNSLSNFRLSPILSVNSAFGGIIMIRSSILQKCSWDEHVSQLHSEHVSFCQNVKLFGDVVIATQVRVKWI